jgi:hypothetical protein
MRSYVDSAGEIKHDEKARESKREERKKALMKIGFKMAFDGFFFSTIFMQFIAFLVTWIFGMDDVWKFKVINDVLILLQGPLIFVALVCKRSVLTRLRDRLACCLPCWTGSTASDGRRSTALPAAARAAAWSSVNAANVASSMGVARAPTISQLDAAALATAAAVAPDFRRDNQAIDGVAAAVVLARGDGQRVQTMSDNSAESSRATTVTTIVAYSSRQGGVETLGLTGEPPRTRMTMLPPPPSPSSWERNSLGLVTEGEEEEQEREVQGEEEEERGGNERAASDVNDADVTEAVSPPETDRGTSSSLRQRPPPPLRPPPPPSPPTAPWRTEMKNGVCDGAKPSEKEPHSSSLSLSSGERRLRRASEPADFMAAAAAAKTAKDKTVAEATAAFPSPTT